MECSQITVQGYLAGYNSGSLDLPECHLDKPAAFKHGWLNGRDDRINKPRDKASVLLARYQMIERNTFPCTLESQA